MTKSTSEQEIRQALAEVRHPEIANTLADLGMLKDVVVEGNKVSLTLLLPVMGIPIQIKDYLVHSIYEALARLDASPEVELNLAEMNDEERAKFSKMAQEAWIG
jgi:ATP-binding protein involved in chromosome partitioning